jgi:hypothetical protein
MDKSAKREQRGEKRGWVGWDSNQNQRLKGGALLGKRLSIAIFVAIFETGWRLGRPVKKRNLNKHHIFCCKVPVVWDSTTALRLCRMTTAG